MALAMRKWCALIVLLIPSCFGVEEDEQECHMSLLQVGLKVEKSAAARTETVEAEGTAANTSAASRGLAVELAATFGHAEGAIWSVAFSPDGSRLASGSGDGKVRIYDLEAEALPSETSPLATLADCPEQVGPVDLWQRKSSPLLLGAGCSCFALEGDQQCADGQWRLYDATSATSPPELLQTTREEKGWEVDGFSFSADSPIFAVASAGGDVQLYSIIDPQAPELVAGVPSNGLTVTTVDIIPHGARMAVGYFDGTLEIHRTSAEGLALLDQRTFDAGVINVAYSPDNRLLAVASADGAAGIFDDIMEANKPMNLAFTIEDASDKLSAVAFSPDSTLLATASWDKKARVYDVSVPSAPRLVATLDDATDKAYAVVFAQHHSTGKLLLATGSLDGKVRVYTVG